MHASDEFLEFCSGIIQNFDSVYGPEPEDWIRGALCHVHQERHVVLRDYLNELLSGHYSDAQLSEIYHGTSPELGFLDDSELRQFLELARDMIGKSRIA